MICEILLHNFMCYRGVHSLTLGPHAYAIVARREDDPSRSNWSGKSTLLEAIDFALYGRLNRERRFDADGWITRGEKQGSVTLTLEDGTVIKRERSRGSATRVTYTREAVKHEKDEAERSIFERMRLGEEDFRATCYFEQRKMARLIHADPSERLGIVSAWLGIEPIERAEERASDIASDHARRATEYSAKRRALADVLASSQGASDDIDATIAKLQKDLQPLQNKLTQLEEARKASYAKTNAQHVIDEYEGIVVEGKKRVAELGKVDVDAIKKQHAKAEERLGKLRADFNTADRDVAMRKRVALGMFDGRCPVADIECPAKERINADRKNTAKALEEAESVRDKARAAFDEAREKTNRVQDEVNRVTRLAGDIERLRERAHALLPRVKVAREAIDDASIRDTDDIERDIHALRERIVQLNDRVTRLRAAKEHAAKLRDEIEQLDSRAGKETKSAQLATMAKKVFRTTHRRVAENALTAINTIANEVLVTAGIDLRVDVRWSREGKSPAKTCDECGAAFPASARVKQCEQCGAARGQHLVNKLEFLLSDRSGAADDLAGVALQLAAGSWLLAARQSAWSAALIDEPFGQLDGYHRRVLAHHLAAMLSGRYGFRQAFVIAHDTAVLDALPGRIEVIGGRDGSKVRVIS